MSIMGHNQYGPFFIDHGEDRVSEIKSLRMMEAADETIVVDSISWEFDRVEEVTDEH
jgi:hypothetical protein